MERDATKSEDMRIALRDAAGSTLVAALGVVVVAFGASSSPKVVELALVIVGAFVAFTGLRAIAITVQRYRWKAARRR